jgi:hypothetical protein
MRKQLLEAIGVAAVILALTVFLKLMSVPVGSQTQGEGSAPGTAAKTSVPKTPWGAPDLQGIWNDEYEIPLQRPAQYAQKEFFTDEERAAIDRQRAGIPGRDKRSSRGTEQDVGGAYNAVFLSMRPTGRRTSLIVDPPDGKLPPFTPEATKRRKAIREFQLALLQATDTCKNKMLGCEGWKYGPPSPRRAETPPHYLTGGVSRSDHPEDRGSSERCMGAILPDFEFQTVINKFNRIVQSPGTVSIFYDTGQGQGWPRIIPVTGSPHLPPHVRQWFGDSRGRWEGNTLVVDVTNFTAKTDFLGSRENLHLVERWTRTGADALEYVVTMEDPTTWTKPWTVKQEMKRQNEQANRVYYEPRCHEGNYGMMALLSGARVQEKAFAQGRGPNPATLCTAGCGSGLDGENADPLTR